MGVEVAIAVVTLAVAAGSAYEQRQQAKEAASDRKKAAKTSQAEQAAQQNQNRRQQVREERVRRAQIAQSAVNTGASGSSGELGSESALGSIINGNLAANTRQQNSAAAIGSLNQSAADADLSAAGWSAIGSTATSVFGVAAGAYTSSKTPTTTKPDAATNQSSIWG